MFSPYINSFPQCVTPSPNVIQLQKDGTSITPAKEQEDIPKLKIEEINSNSEE